MSVALSTQRAKSRPTKLAEANDDDSDISGMIARLTAEVNQIAVDKTKSIQQITNQMKMLALNALIESSRAGAQGAGFAVVAQEVRGVGQLVENIARELETELTKRTGSLMSSIDQMVKRSRGERLVDLSLNAIELIDRNLYERTCDVRWWATDSAVVDCATAPVDAILAQVSERVGVILSA
jgi:methyl-accepting chemotaxis protein